MTQTIQEYYLSSIEKLFFTLLPEYSQQGDYFYRMKPQYGQGSLRIISFNNMFIFLIADYIPNEDFEKVSEISQSYIEISQFETSSSAFKVGKQNIKPVKKGICCYINKTKQIHVYCKAKERVCFTKVVISQEYYDTFLKERYGDNHCEAKNAMKFLTLSPNLPEFGFIFQQIKSCKATGLSQYIYLEGKVLELLALATYRHEQSVKKEHLNVKVSKNDLRSLKKVIKFMEKNLSKYPSIKDLSKIANMSTTRFQLAFRKTYGTTIYEYFKTLRMNHALLLLRDSESSIKSIASEVGYNNAGHFSGVFKKMYGVTPKKYRDMQHIV
ncbi:helix-turn-helix domain-containing protein [Tepidibacter hydrothermalis]|uniref:AraC family transcriptional regulator n=1 Tax=Tepidibacter hydrothermalis TaxID=3036126 RepID=A0ABY8EDJ0_9FIRM|nr:AraC family transcriptional regulator [Tepidibacter hydrothermalis]WFD09649.1 AraC family transcriptional regulator [Tepidibacter hydrothermalis]